MKKLLFLMTFCALLFGEMLGQPIRVAVANTVKGQGNVQQVHLDQVRNRLNSAVMSAQGLSLAPRSTEVNALLSDYDFESNSTLTDAKKAILAKVENVDFVCISKISEYSGEYYISALFLNKSTGEPTNLVDEIAYGGKPSEIQEACLKLFDKLLKQLGVSSSPSPSQRGGKDYTETAWNINMKMVWVEGGDFLMGCTSEQGSSCNTDEQNVRRVTVDGYYIAMVEVTQSQWEKVMGTTIYQQKSKTGGSNVYGTGPDYPMYYVSWEEAMDFCRQLNQKTGRKYTLPTEAQWEYAARGGKNPDGTKYAGRSSVDAVAWYDGNSGSSTHPVATKQPNALGLYDMSGNVWEWCRDWYSAGYAGYDTNNPQGPESGSLRVNRGGGWSNNASYCRVSYRNYLTPSSRNSYLGFRVVCLP